MYWQKSNLKQLAERRQNMNNQSLPSIEKFAAYLDGNLSNDEMQHFLQLVANNEDLKHLLEASSEVEEILSSYDDIDLRLPEEIANLDFKLPEIENIDSFNLVDDSFLGNNSLLKQEDFHLTEKIIDEVFDDEIFVTENVDDMDIDGGHDVDMDVFDILN